MKLGACTVGAVFMTIALLVAGCSAGDEQSVDEGQGQNPTPGTADPLPTVCDEDHGLTCTSVNGQVLVYYPAPGPSQGVVIWDGGGPGAVPLDAGAARAALPEWTRGFDLVSFAEPWTYRVLDTNCIDGVTHGLEDGGSADISACPWSELVVGESQFAAGLRFVQHHYGEVRGIYASSFGAVRALQIDQALRSEPWSRRTFVVLESPAPLPSIAGERLLRARARNTRAAVLVTPKDCSVRGATKCETERVEVLDALLGGSYGVDPQTAAFGVLGLSYSLHRNVAFLRQLWTKHGLSTRVAEATLRESAYSFESVTSSHEATPALVGYLAQSCTSYQGWRSQSKNTGLLGALETMHRLCSEIRRETPQTTITERLFGPVYLVVNRRDPIAPGPLQNEWARITTREKTSTFGRLAHVGAPNSIEKSIGQWVDTQMGES